MTSLTPPTRLSYEDDARMERARERAKTLDRLVGIRGKRVLEVGCGDGDLCRVLATEYDCDVVGTEIRRQENWARLKTERVEFMEVDIAATALAENSFDRIVSFVVWEHMRHPWSALQACQRMLKPTGKKYLHAYLYGWPNLSHVQYEIPEPWLHLTHSPREIKQRLQKDKLPWYFWCTRLSHQHYLNYFRQLGLYVTYQSLIRGPFPEDFYREHEELLGLYPEYDLKTHGFQVVLEFDRDRPKAPIPDPVFRLAKR